MRACWRVASVNKQSQSIPRPVPCTAKYCDVSRYTVLLPHTTPYICDRSYRMCAMGPRLLERIALRCPALPRGALQCAALPCNALRCPALPCGALHCAAMGLIRCVFRIRSERTAVRGRGFRAAPPGTAAMPLAALFPSAWSVSSPRTTTTCLARRSWTSPPSARHAPTPCPWPCQSRRRCPYDWHDSSSRPWQPQTWPRQRRQLHQQ